MKLISRRFVFAVSFTLGAAVGATATYYLITLLSQ